MPHIFSFHLQQILRRSFQNFILVPLHCCCCVCTFSLHFKLMRSFLIFSKNFSWMLFAWPELKIMITISHENNGHSRTIDIIVHVNSHFILFPFQNYITHDAYVLMSQNLKIDFMWTISKHHYMHSIDTHTHTHLRLHLHSVHWMRILLGKWNFED